MHFQEVHVHKSLLVLSFSIMKTLSRLLNFATTMKQVLFSLERRLGFSHALPFSKTSIHSALSHGGGVCISFAHTTKNP